MLAKKSLETRDAHNDALVRKIPFAIEWVTHGTTGEAVSSAKVVKFMGIYSARAVLLQVHQQESPKSM